MMLGMGAGTCSCGTMQDGVHSKGGRQVLVQGASCMHDPASQAPTTSPCLISNPPPPFSAPYSRMRHTWAVGI